MSWPAKAHLMVDVVVMTIEVSHALIAGTMSLWAQLRGSTGGTMIGSDQWVITVTVLVLIL